MPAAAPPRPLEVAVQSLILVLLLVWFVLSVFLAAGTLWLQAYIYTEPVQGLIWRAPAAGTVVFLSILLWVYLDYQAPARYSTLWQFSAEDEIIYPKLIVPRRDGKEDVYRRVRGDRGFSYHGADHPIPSRPDKIIALQENGERRVFEPDRDEKGKFKVASGQSLLYKDSTGLVMEEGQLGSVRTFYPSRLILNLFLNFLLLVTWFVSLWLVLRFQLSRAFGMAVVLWGVMLLFIMPQVLKLAEDAAHQRAAPATATTRQAVPGNLLDGDFANG
jgi:hypothetical protein